MFCSIPLLLLHSEHAEVLLCHSQVILCTVHEQISKWDVTSPKTNVQEACIVRTCLICLIFWRLNISVWHFILIWYLNVKLWPSHVPSSLILSWHLTRLPQTLMLLVEHLWRCCWEPNRMNSVFSEFILSLFWFIDPFTLSMHCSKQFIVSASCPQLLL